MPVVAKPAHFAAPVGGWNALDAIAAMPATDAVRMDNLFPETSYIRLRHGSQVFYQISTAAVPIKTLMTYSNSLVGDRLLAATGGEIIDITNQTNTVIGSGATSDAWEYVNFATPGGQFWVGVNGTGPQYIWSGSGGIFAGSNTNNGTTDTTKPWSMVASYQSRLFFAGSQDLVLSYLPVNVYQGEAHGIDLGSYFVKGGNIAFIGTWTRDDSTIGMNELLVVGSTNGEIICFLGSDPDSPTLSYWSLAGLFEMGRPVSGHRQLCRLGPDMMLLCQDGFQSLSNYITLGQSKALTAAISRKIGNAVTQAVSAAKELDGWCAILWPTRNALLVNVPQPGGGFQQYVVNTVTGAWCRFLGLNAYCWTVFNDALFFGADNSTVMQADSGGDDNGVPIAFDLITAFQIFGNIQQQKRACMVRPFMIAAGAWYPMLDVNVDYTLSNVTSTLNVQTAGTLWDHFNWDQADWGTTGGPQHDWYSAAGIGTSFAVRMSGMAKSASLQLFAFDVTYEPAIGFV